MQFFIPPPHVENSESRLSVIEIRQNRAKPFKDFGNADRVWHFEIFCKNQIILTMRRLIHLFAANSAAVRLSFEELMPNWGLSIIC